jgi:hypothetical protein
MSPVERRSSSATTTAVLVGIAGVVAGLGLVWFMVNLASQGTESVQVRLGDDRFDAGNVDNRADSIADGGPVLFPDVAGRTRDIYLQHLGDEPDEGWSAFSAQAVGKPRDCFLQWQADTADFEDCDGDRYPADGDHPSLTSYPVSVEDGRLFVDLNAEFRNQDGEGDEGEDDDDGLIRSGESGD